MKTNLHRARRLPIVLMLLGIVGVVGCDGIPGTIIGSPEDPGAIVRDFLVELSRQALAAFLF
jgi:hypothetical protein